MTRQKITPCLWFDAQAEEAAAYYVSIFPNSAVTNVTPGPAGPPWWSSSGWRGCNSWR
jgi:predicted 3-demethylubiquinone-9 3-methyltransferase (glyoxalase superfamily)